MTEKRRSTLSKDSRGVVYLETLVAFMPVFMFFLGTLQLADLSVAHLIVQHASSTAARAAVVVLPDDGAYYEDHENSTVHQFTGLRRADVELAADLVMQASPRLSLTAVELDKQSYVQRDDLTATVKARYRCLIASFCGSGLPLESKTKLVYQGAQFVYEPTTVGEVVSVHRPPRRPGNGGTPSDGTPGDGRPGTPSDGTPGTPSDGRPGTPSDGTPGTPGDSTPGRPGDGRPGDGTPGTPGDSNPNGHTTPPPGTSHPDFPISRPGSGAQPGQGSADTSPGTRPGNGVDLTKPSDQTSANNGAGVGPSPRDPTHSDSHATPPGRTDPTPVAGDGRSPPTDRPGVTTPHGDARDPSQDRAGGSSPRGPPGVDLTKPDNGSLGPIAAGPGRSDGTLGGSPPNHGNHDHPPFVSPNGRPLLPVLNPQCFAAGTLVYTANGDRPIETIRVGDLVWSRDDQTGELSLKPVERLFITEDKPILEVGVERAGVRDVLQVTPGHPFWVEGRGWVDSDALDDGSELWSPEGSALGARSLDIGARSRVYNFEVRDFHTYFVGSLHTWVHNAASCDDPPGTYRDENGSLHDAKTGRFVADPNAKGDAKPDFTAAKEKLTDVEQKSLEDVRLDPSDPAVADALSARDQAIAARNRHNRRAERLRKRGDEEGAKAEEEQARKAQAAANKATEQLGDLAVDPVVKALYGESAVRVHTGEGPGTFDAVYRIPGVGGEPDRYVIVEAKGGTATNSSSRQVDTNVDSDGRRYQQGTPEYRRDVLNHMAQYSSDPATRALARRLLVADDEVDYIEVSQPLNTRGMTGTAPTTTPRDPVVKRYGNESVPAPPRQNPDDGDAPAEGEITPT